MMIRAKKLEDPVVREILRYQRLIIAGLVALCFSGNVAAEDEMGWDWQLTPLYYWAINIDGNQTSGESNPPIDTGDFGINFEGAFTSNFQGLYNNRWGFETDLIWVNLSSTRNFSTLDFEYLQAELTGFYRVPIGRQAIEFIAGARYYESDVALEPGSIAGDASWVDPVIGARWNWPFADQWTLTVRGDIGGFGVGSDFSWQTLLVANWQPWEHVSITGALRALGMEFSTGQGADFYAMDITFWGPLLGVTFKW
jgi:hypothetical protein